MLEPSAHVDSFARDNLPPPDQWPTLSLERFRYPRRLNAAVELTACAKESAWLRTVAGFDGTSNHDAELDRLALEKPVRFDAVEYRK